MAPAAARDWQLRWYQLVRSMARVHTPRGEDQLLDWLLRPGEARVLAFINAHAMNTVAESPAFFNSLMSADVVVRDGIGMSMLMRLCNQVPGQNLNGTDLIPKLLERADGQTIALFGTREPWLSTARDEVLARIAPRSSVITANGFLDTVDYIRLAARHKPRLIVLGMGMPRQEEVAMALRGALGTSCLIVCGGAIIDFLGGKVPRAPTWMREHGLEWAFRLCREPRRLWDRYVRGNPRFLRRAFDIAERSWRHGWPAVA